MINNRRIRDITAIPSPQRNGSRYHPLAHWLGVSVAGLRVLLLSVCLILAYPSSGYTQTTAASKAEAIAVAQRQNGSDGKVLSVKEVTNGTSTTFIVKLLTNGRVTIHSIPGQSQ